MTVDEDKPTKTDLIAVFKKLRSYNANKVCFDCGTNNPTWASVTYGVFICIDCSAIHRGLGVHLSFVRSTQLDTNWTWLQLRAMQVGGNALATQFFCQHGCNTADAQEKYKSRSAQLYREKVHHQAVAAIRLHGTKLHIDTAQDPHSPHSPVGKDVDWFEEHTSHEPAANGSVAPVGDAGLIKGDNRVASGDLGTVPGPNVDSILGSSPPSGSAAMESLKTSVIGQRKPPAKKLGAKKGLGAQRVKTDFSEIEKNAETLDQEKTVLQNLSTTEDSPAVQEISARLMVQDINKKRETLEKKISDPTKGEQAERLGMGFIGNKSQVSHSVFSDMKNVKHDTSWQSANPQRPSKSNFDALDDEWDVVASSTSSFDKKGKSGYDDLFAKGDSDKFFDAMESPDTRAAKPNSSYAPAPAVSNEAQSKFKNAKAISSDMFFGDKASGFETQTTLSRFDGQNAISSADYFGGGPGTSKGNVGSGGLSNSYYNNVPDMTDIKDSVRTGVTKVAGRLSNISSSVSSYISDNYSGY